MATSLDDTHFALSRPAGRQAILSYSIAGLPGQFSPSLNWSNQAQSDFANPFGPFVSPTQIPLAVGNLLGLASNKGLIVNEKDESEFAIANFSQYLFVKDNPVSVAEKLRTGQVINGIGIFGRFGVTRALSGCTICTRPAKRQEI